MLEETSEDILSLNVSEALDTIMDVVSTINIDGSSVLLTLSWQIVSCFVSWKPLES